MEQNVQDQETDEDVLKEYITKAEFAKRVNRSRADITKAIKNGVIVTSDVVRDRIEYTSQRKRWNERYIGKQNMAALKKDAEKAIENGADDENAAVSMYNSRARREKALAEKAELQTEQLKGTLVKRSEVEKAIAEWAQTIKERMMDIPDRISPKESSDVIAYVAAVSSDIVAKNTNISPALFSEKLIKDMNMTDIERIIVKNWEESIRYVLSHIDDCAGYRSNTDGEDE